MKTFYEWLELNEAGFFSNLFGKKAPVPATPAPAVVAPEKKGMDIAAFRKLMDGPNSDPTRKGDDQKTEPAPASSQPKLSSSPQNPEEYLEEVANKYWTSGKEHPPFFGMYSGELHEMWNEYKQKNDAGSLHALYYTIAIKEENHGQVVEAVKNAMIEILEKKFRWLSFPKTDTVELGPGRGQLAEDKVIFVDGRRTRRGMARVLARGFEDRRGNVMAEAAALKIK